MKKVVILITVLVLIISGCTPEANRDGGIANTDHDQEEFTEKEQNQLADKRSDTRDPEIEKEKIPIENVEEMTTNDDSSESNEESTELSCEDINCPDGYECQQEDKVPTCVSIDLCRDVDCEHHEKCREGECIPKSCSELGGDLCSEGETCADLIFVTDQICCKDACESEPQGECQIDADCDDDEPSTLNKCNGLIKDEKCIAECTCFETLITSCNDDDGYCPDGCSDANDNDCGEPSGDIAVQGPITIADMGGKLNPKCSSGFKYTYFTTISTFSETASLGSAKIYLDDELIHSWTPVTVEPGTNEFRLKIREENINNKEVKIEFSKGSFIHESDYSNNEISEQLGEVCEVD